MTLALVALVAFFAAPAGAPRIDAASTPASLPTAPTAPAARPALVERVVAVIDRQTITLTDLKQAAAIELAKRAGALALKQQWPDDFLEDIRKHLVQQTLLLEEAQRYSQAGPTDAEVEAALVDLRKHFPDERWFQRFLSECALSLDETREILRRDIRVDKFLESRIRSRLEVRDQDISNYRLVHPETRQFPDETVAQRVLDDLFVKKTLEYLRELAEKAEVRLIGSVRTGA